jgi:hypothetical protein
MAATATLERATQSGKYVSSRVTAAGLIVLCGVLCALRWGKLDTLWGDSARWMFEAYRASTGELPYRDFAWQYPPLAILLCAAALAAMGAKFAVLQGLLDVVSTIVVLLTWDTARRYLPGVLPICAAIALACAGAANTGNFALFSLQVYTPAILIGMIGLLLVIRELTDYLQRGSLPRKSFGWIVLGTTIGMLSKPEFILGVVGCFAAVAIVDLRGRFRDSTLSEWASFHAFLSGGALAPALVAYIAAAVLCGWSNVMAGIAGYGIAARACPWWPTGLGLFGAAVAVGYGVIAAAGLLLLHVRCSWTFHRQTVVRLCVGALISIAGVLTYLPYTAAELPVFSGGMTPVRFVGYLLSTGTVLLPVMWIGILLWIVLTAGLLRQPKASRTEPAMLLLLLTPAVLISLRGLFGGTMSQLTQVSVAAYPIWFIVGSYLMYRFLRGFVPVDRAIATVALIVSAYAALRLGGAAVTEVRTLYTRLNTDAGTIRLQDSSEAPKVYAYVLAHTDPGEPIVDVAAGGVNFAGHRGSPIFSTQFTALSPEPRYLDADLSRIEHDPPRIVIANDGPNFQASYGLCLNTACTFPRLVWRSNRLACDPSQSFPVLDYIRSHYRPAAHFGQKVIYTREEASLNGQ